MVFSCPYSLVNISNLTTTFIRSVNGWILNTTLYDLVSYRPFIVYTLYHGLFQELQQCPHTVKSAQLNVVIYNEDNSSLNNSITITDEGAVVAAIFMLNITENKIWRTAMTLSLLSGIVISVTESTILSEITMITSSKY